MGRNSTNFDYSSLSLHALVAQLKENLAETMQSIEEFQQAIQAIKARKLALEKRNARQSSPN